MVVYYTAPGGAGLTTNTQNITMRTHKYTHEHTLTLTMDPTIIQQTSYISL